MEEHSNNSCLICGGNGLVVYNLPGYSIWRCKDCSLLFTKNQEYKSLKCSFGEKYFTQEYAGHFLGDQKQAVDRFKNIISNIDAIYPKAEKHVLDIGCGLGLFLNIAREHGWCTSGIDVSDWAVEQAKQDYGLNVSCGQLEQAEFEDNSFDVITLFQVLENIPDITEFLCEIKRVLKPGGLLVIRSPDASGLIFAVADFIYRISSAKIYSHLQPLYDSHHLYHFSKQTLQKLLGQTGLDVIKTVPESTRVSRLNISWSKQLFLKMILILGVISGRQNRVIVYAGNKKDKV